MSVPTVFYTNKKSANILLIGGSVFAVICFATTMGWVAYIQTFVTVVEFQILSAIICTSVFISVLIAYKKKLKPREAIVISNEGVNDTMYELSYGLINWEDIKNVSVDNSLVVIGVENHDAYLSRSKSPGIKRMWQNYIKKYNTPVVLNTGYLICSATELATAIQAGQGYRHKNST